MTVANRCSVEQIFAKWERWTSLRRRGVSIHAACKKVGIADQTFCRWRLKYRQLKWGRGAASEGP